MAHTHRVDLAARCGAAVQIHRSAAAPLLPRSAAPAAHVVTRRAAITVRYPPRRYQRADRSFAKVEYLKEANY